MVRTPTREVVGAGVALVVALLLLVATPGASAAAGVDETYGDGGRQATELPGPEGGTASQVLARRDGRLVVSARVASDSGASTVAVAQLLPRGGLDRFFGQHGVVTLDDGWLPGGMALLPDGRLAVAAEVDRPAGSGLGVVLLTTTGWRDASFGDDGTVVVDLGGAAVAPIGIASVDGRLVLAGAAEDRSLTAVALTLDGDLDPSFGDGGIVVTEVVYDATPGADRLAVGADGSVIVPGTPLVRLSPDGDVEPLAHPDGVGALHTPELLLGGDLVSVGHAGSGDEARPVVVKHRADGSLDTSFGVGGVALVANEDIVELAGLAAQHNGRLVSAAHVTDPDAPGGSGAAVLRLTPDGLPDPTFGRRGLVRLPGPVDGPVDLALRGATHVVVLSDYRPSGGVPEVVTHRVDLGPSTPVPTLPPIDTSLACPDGRVPDAGFVDVGGVHAPAIDCVAWWEIARGTSPTAYEPSRVVSRGAMASFIAQLVLATGGDLPPAADQGFTDVGGSAHEGSINRLAAAGIVRGTSATTFSPAAPVTRAQMATFLVAAYEHRTGEALVASANWFHDAVGSPHQESINKAAEAGFATGTEIGRYEPSRRVTRAPMASFLARTVNALVRDGWTLPPDER